jgi:membrane associated rhomboid family serine protease
MSEAARNPDDYCYRHPDRLSFVLCERCGRTICLECQNHVGGKVLCPDDAANARVTQLSSASRSPRTRRVRRPLFTVPDGMPIVSYSIIAVILVVFLADAFSRGAVIPRLALIPGAVLAQPWTLLTSMVTSIGILSVVFNGFSIYVFGAQLERTFGRGRYLALYVLSGFGAAVFAFLLDGLVASASGAIFGLMGAYLIFARRMGGNQIWLYVIVGINVLFVILFPGAVTWQGCIGGLLAGAATAFVYLFEGSAERARRMRLLLIGITALLLALAVVRAFAFGA